MKNLKLYIIVGILLMANSIAFAQCGTPNPIDQKTILGTWKGNYTNEGEMIPFTLKLSTVSGVLTASIDIPSLKSKDIAYDINLCRSQEIHLRKKEDNTSIEFKGKPINNKISGLVIYRRNNKVVAEEVFTLKKISGDLVSN